MKPVSNSSLPLTAVVVHVYHWDIWQGIATRLKGLQGRYTLYITLDTAAPAAKLAELQKSFPEAQVRPFANQGMDILPFLQVIPELAEKGYQQVLKLHTKKGQTDFGPVWGEALLEALIGHANYLTHMEAAFNQNPSLALAGPSAFYLSGKKLMLGNQATLDSLSQTLLQQPLPQDDWGFFAGSMFWTRPQAWQKLASWATANTAAFAGDYQQDGQWVHALERFFGLVCYTQGQAVGLLHPSQAEGEFALQVVPSGQAQINQAGTRTLGSSLKTLANIQVLFSTAGLLDAKAYQTYLMRHGLGDSLQHQIDLVQHYLLIGQYSGGRGTSLAWHLHCKNRTLAWDQLLEQQRVAGRVSIIIPVFNQLALTRQCIASLVEHTQGQDYEILLVDNGSDATTAKGLDQLATQYPQLRLVRQQKNQNFALGSNLGFAQASGEFCVFLNNDTQVTPGWLPPLIARLQQGDVYAAQPLLLYPDGSVQCMGVVFSEKSNLGYPIYQGMQPEACQAEKPRTFQAITAACMAITAKDFARGKGFDPIYINGQEDIDLCLRLKNETGKQAAYVPISKVIHHESKTQGRGKYIDQNRWVFVERCEKKIKPDDENHYQRDGISRPHWAYDRHEDSKIKAIKTEIKSTGKGNTGMKKKEPTLLKQANKAFRSSDYSLALELYQKVKPNESGLNAESYKFNIELCQKKLGIQTEETVSQKNKDFNSYNHKEELISHGSVDLSVKKGNAVILMHVYYLELVDEILKRLESADSSMDVIVTCRAEIADKLKEKFESLKRKFEIVIVENIGYDLHPFMKSLLLARQQGYELFCKIHTKRDHPAAHIGSCWRESLLDGVLPDKANISRIVDLLQSDEAVSVVGSALNYISYGRNKYDNDRFIKEILPKIKQPMPEFDFGFFTGTMFWGRTIDFDYINEYLIEYLENYNEKTAKSGDNSSIWHALERLIALPVIGKKKKIALMDYYINNEKEVSASIRIKSPDSFLKYSSELRYKAFQNRHTQRNYILLQKSSLVNPEWCFQAFEKKAPYDCYQSYLNNEIPFLSQEHKDNRITLAWGRKGLYVQSSEEDVKISLDKDFLSENILPECLVKEKPKLIPESDGILVSVICITYLHEKYIAQAIESMVQQKTNFNYEILISDDCSPDQTEEIIKKYEKKYPGKIYYIKRNNNLGTRKNVDDLIRRARGKYIAFNEGDDYWIDANKLQLQVDYLEKTPSCSLCFHQVQVVDEKDPGTIAFFPGKQLKSIFTTEDFIQRNYIQTNSLVFRKNNLGVSELNDERIMPGDWYRHTLNSISGDAHLLPLVMSVYRKHSGGIWSSQGTDLHKKWGLQEVVFFDSLDKQLNYIFSHNIFGKKYSLFKISFFHFYQTNQKKKLYELCEINLNLTNYFMVRHGIDFIMVSDLSYENFIDTLGQALSIDVIVTSYNHEQHIEQALKSILDQEGVFKVNIYVSDDCSTDATQTKIKELENRYHGRITNISPAKNLGLQKNMQQAFSYIKSNYFAICEGDDYWLDESKLRKQVCYLIENQDASMCFNWILLEYVNKGYSVPHPGQEKIPSNNIDFDYILKTAVTANFSCCMYRSSILKSIPQSYYDNPRAADWLFNLFAANEGKVGFLRDILSVYRVHDGGQWSKLTPNEQAYRRNEGYKLFSQLFPERKESIQKFVNSDMELINPALNTKRKLIVNSGNIKYNLDKVTCEFGFLTLSGWALPKERNIMLESKNYWAVILDENNNIAEHFACKTVKRADVKKALKDCSNEDCGFNVTLKIPDKTTKNHALALCFESQGINYAQIMISMRKIIAMESI